MPSNKYYRFLKSNLSKIINRLLAAIGLIFLIIFVSGWSYKSYNQLILKRAPAIAELSTEMALETSVWNGIRTWGDDGRYWPDAYRQREKSNQALNYLAISGGGPDGAYGAGLLVGWSESGSRPVFDVVTGISVGGLMAPFVYLGKDYDDELKALFTEYTTNDLLDFSNPLLIPFNQAAAKSDGFHYLIKKYINETVINEIAKAYDSGRVLLVGTTNLDVSRPVIWNISKIAATKPKGYIKLIHNIFQASAAIPGVFPPMMLQYKVDNKNFSEMHVDGGITRQVFFDSGYDETYTGKRESSAKLFVIMNQSEKIPFSEVPRKSQTIFLRSLLTLLRAQGRGDIYEIYARAQSLGIDFYTKGIPSTFSAPRTELFDKSYMQTLFQKGYDDGKNDVQWQRKPRGLLGE